MGIFEQQPQNIKDFLLTEKSFFENEKVIIYEDKTKQSRPGREIKLTNIKNKNISVKIGTIENKSCPNTIYLIFTFWVDIKNKEVLSKEYGDRFDHFITRELKKELNNIYKNDLREILSSNALFPYYKDNIYITDFTDNLNYNDKRNFVSIDLSLNTINCDEKNKKKYPLNHKPKKGNLELYNEILKVVNLICDSDILNGKGKFDIFKRKN